MPVITSPVSTDEVDIITMPGQRALGIAETLLGTSDVAAEAPWLSHCLLEEGFELLVALRHGMPVAYIAYLRKNGELDVVDVQLDRSDSDDVARRLIARLGKALGDDSALRGGLR